jgi:hypothetical protein
MPLQKFSLAFAIPTYKRSKQILQTLMAIDAAAASAKLFSICCYVSDNDPASDLRSTLNGALFSNIDLHYNCNSSNIGAGANILRVCSDKPNDYIWPIGDDSNVDYSFLLPCVEHILINEDPDILFISSTPRFLSSVSHPTETKSPYQLLSSSVFFAQPLSGEEGFLGRWIYKNSRLFNDLLVQAIPIENYAHPYLFLSYALIQAHHSLSILTSDYIKSGSDPDLKNCQFRVLPRWSVAAAHFGAWKTAFYATIGLITPDPNVCKLIHSRESDYRLPIILNALFRDAFGFAPCQLDISNIMWILKRSSFRGTPIAIAVMILYLLRNSSLLSCLLLTLLWFISQNFRNVIRLYLRTMGKLNCSYRDAIGLILSRHSRFRLLSDSETKALGVAY